MYAPLSLSIEHLEHSLTKHSSKADQEIFNRVFIQAPDQIRDEVLYLFEAMNPGADQAVLAAAFVDTIKLFNGDFKGYHSCKTPYHDLTHTLSVFLATARLMHGACLEHQQFKHDSIVLGLITALFHDTGLIQTEDDTEGTGAKYSIGHEARSIRFTKLYLSDRNLFSKYLDDCAHIIGCTIMGLSTKEIAFRSDETRLMGYMLGSADLLAQMADRLYLEKLLYLYREFVEGGMPGFHSELDLLKSTESFYRDVSKKRLNEELGGVASLMRVHFQDRLGEDRDFYEESIKKNIDYLRRILFQYEEDYRQMLRRAGIVASLEKDGYAGD